ncbi:MAG: restriction endonuclease [Alphaproteobacteria bacterium]|nr:MAG: restriction endonuclease [Alphaproteobacteria bacterium]
MAIPDFQTLMLPVLQACAAGEIRAADLVEALAKRFDLTVDEQAALLPSGRQTTFANRTHWAISYLGKAGLVERTRRAHYRVTARGQQVLATSPPRIDIKFLGQFPEFQSFRETPDRDHAAPLTSAAPEASPVLTPDEVMRRAHQQLEDALAEELLQRIWTSTPKFFESLVVRLLVAMGYGGSVTDVSKALVGGPGDGGIDRVIDQDALGLDRIFVQAKRYARENVIGPGAIRDFFGALDIKKASKGVFVTSSAFSTDAIQTTNLLGKRIVLIDGPQLARILIRFNVGCRVEETLTIKRIDEEFFEG